MFHSISVLMFVHHFFRKNNYYFKRSKERAFSMITKSLTKVNGMAAC